MAVSLSKEYICTSTHAWQRHSKSTAIGTWPEFRIAVTSLQGPRTPERNTRTREKKNSKRIQPGHHSYFCP
eukprot:336025-Pelagomonas_calceolata.AAC.4